MCLKKFKNDRQDFSQAVNYCLANLKEKRYYLENVDNENTSQRSKKFGNKLYDYMVEILIQMLNNNSQVDDDEMSSILEIKNKKNDDIYLFDENKNINIQLDNINNNDSENSQKSHESKDDNKYKKNNKKLTVKASTSMVTRNKYNQNINCSLNNDKNTMPKTEIKYNEICSNDDSDLSTIYNDNDEALLKKSKQKQDYNSQRKGKKYSCISYEQKITIVELSDNNPLWSLEKIKEASCCNSIRSKFHITLLKHELKKDKQMMKKFQGINDIIYQRCVNQNSNIKTITDSKLKLYAEGAKKLVGTTNGFKVTKAWLYLFKMYYGLNEKNEEIFHDKQNQQGYDFRTNIVYDNKQDKNHQRFLNTEDNGVSEYSSSDIDYHQDFVPRKKQKREQKNSLDSQLNIKQNFYCE
ncbi:hypothetical protein HCN44_004457 [Aphidius gifuensis]|uniref:Uncharacterized protein n=1 Tax=Aphidius gifuensis TaxID=684658 RepID=A0A835CW14_APHGI|nr:hypothetical protein HCN44_004457 [Aphidius gifuensis]